MNLMEGTVGEGRGLVCGWVWEYPEGGECGGGEEGGGRGCDVREVVRLGKRPVCRIIENGKDEKEKGASRRASPGRLTRSSVDERRSEEM